MPQSAFTPQKSAPIISDPNDSPEETLAKQILGLNAYQIPDPNQRRSIWPYSSAGSGAEDELRRGSTPAEVGIEFIQDMLHNTNDIILPSQFNKDPRLLALAGLKSARIPNK